MVFYYLLLLLCISAFSKIHAHEHNPDISLMQPKGCTPATRTNVLFSTDSFPMPPTFAETYIFGWHLSFPHGLAGRCFPGEDACKSHPSFNLHTFRPSFISPNLPSLFGCPHFLPADLGNCFRQISPNRATKKTNYRFYLLLPNKITNHRIDGRRGN